MTGPAGGAAAAGPGPVALFVSPHLDDVAFSCGATLARLAAAGWRAHLCTVFTRSVAEPAGFALACQLDKGLAASVDYMALRREEDAAFGRRVGAHDVTWMDHAEAPHRGYAAAPELFGDVRAGDVDAWRPVADDLAALVRHLRPALLFAPQALGGHVDHRHVVRAVRALPAAVGAAAPPVAWYRDAPYVIRRPDARPPDPLEPEVDAAALVAVDVTPALAAKLDGAAAYASQLGFQFGGEGAMRATFTAWAAEEARAAGGAGAAERFAAAGAARAALAAVGMP